MSETRCFFVTEPNRPAYVIASSEGVIFTGFEWMIGKTLQEIKPYLLEKKAKVKEVTQ